MKCSRCVTFSVCRMGLPMSTRSPTPCTLSSSTSTEATGDREMRYEIYGNPGFGEPYILLAEADSYLEALTWVTFKSDRIYDTVTATWL